MSPEFWIVVTQWDMDPSKASTEHPAKGPLVWESYCMTRREAEKRAAALSDYYGWKKVMLVAPDKTIVADVP